MIQMNLDEFFTYIILRLMKYLYRGYELFRKYTKKISRSSCLLELIGVILNKIYSSKIKIELSRNDQERLEHWLHLQQYIEQPFDGLFRHLV